MNMTPLQKLLRLKHLHALPTLDAAQSLELSDIYKSVGLPPAHLAANDDPDAWSQAIADHIPGVDMLDVYAWLVTFGANCHASGFEQGQGAAPNHPGFVECVEVLETLVKLIGAGRVRQTGPLMRNESAYFISDDIRAALEAAGRPV